MISLSAHISSSNGNGRQQRAPSVQLPADFNVDEFVSQRFVRRNRSKQNV